MMRWQIPKMATSRVAATIALTAIGVHFAKAANFGASRTHAECKSEHAQYDSLYLSGEREPFFSTGPSEDCDTQGCQDGFWGPRARYLVEPTCPKDLVHGLTSWLRDLASQDSQWAKGALLLQPCDFWQYMQGRTTWVLGDSVTENIGSALTSMMMEYWDKEHWEVQLTSNEHIKAALHHGVAEGAHGGGKRVPFWCFEMGSPGNWGRLCYLKADRAKRSMHVLNVLPSISKPDDILLLNIGVHYNDIEELEDDMTMLGFALDSPRLPKHKIWVETPPQHYETPTGMFNVSRPIKEQMCFPAGHAQGTNITIFADGTIGVQEGAHRPHPGSHRDVALQRLLAGGERNMATQPIVDALGIPTLRTWNTSIPLYQFHEHVHLPGDGECAEIPCDCTHVCFPSAPQLSLANFLQLLRRTFRT